jgi:hypothetical protein
MEPVCELCGKELPNGPSYLRYGPSPYAGVPWVYPRCEDHPPEKTDAADS